MDKISHILPSTARTQAADVSTSQPARPGAPSTGRVEGKVTPRSPSLDVTDKVSMSGAVPADGKSIEESMPTYKNNRAADTARAKVVDELSKKFFDTKTIKDVRGEIPGSEAAINSVEIDQEIAGLKQG